MLLNRTFKLIFKLDFVSWKSAFAAPTAKYAVSPTVFRRPDSTISSLDTNVSRKLLRLDWKLRIYLSATWSFAELDSLAFTMSASHVEAEIRTFALPEII